MGRDEMTVSCCLGSSNPFSESGSRVWGWLGRPLLVGRGLFDSMFTLAHCVCGVQTEYRLRWRVGSDIQGRRETRMVRPNW